MKNLLILFGSLFLFSCSGVKDEAFKKIFMANCAPGDDPVATEYCECIYIKLESKYSNDWSQVDGHDWNSEETKSWMEECITE